MGLGGSYLLFNFGCLFKMSLRYEFLVCRIIFNSYFFFVKLNQLYFIINFVIISGLAFHTHWLGFAKYHMARQKLVKMVSTVDNDIHQFTNIISAFFYCGK
jgi:hypothetical protein